MQQVVLNRAYGREGPQTSPTAVGSRTLQGDRNLLQTPRAVFIFQTQFCGVHCGPLSIIRCHLLGAFRHVSCLSDAARDGLYAEFRLLWATPWKHLSEEKEQEQESTTET